MALPREEALVECLKHISLQRLRTLKMDMDRLARDSRIGSEHAFWSLLEFHNIRLDERTRREFRIEISDNRGVNTETAMNHLRKAQKKTGRDSVEVLPKETRQQSTEPARKIPKATTILEKIPTKMPLRNYKLDKFRSKAIGLGKLRVALKGPSTAPSTTEATKDNDREKAEEQFKAVSSTKSEEMKEQVKNSITSTKLPVLNSALLPPLTKQTKTISKDAESNDDTGKPTIDRQDNSKKESSKSTPFLQLILEEKTVSTNLESVKSEVSQSNNQTNSISNETATAPTLQETNKNECVKKTIKDDNNLETAVKYNSVDFNRESTDVKHSDDTDPFSLKEAKVSRQEKPPEKKESNLVICSNKNNADNFSSTIKENILETQATEVPAAAEQSINVTVNPTQRQAPVLKTLVTEDGVISNDICNNPVGMKADSSDSREMSQATVNNTSNTNNDEIKQFVSGNAAKQTPVVQEIITKLSSDSQPTKPDSSPNDKEILVEGNSSQTEIQQDCINKSSIDFNPKQFDDSSSSNSTTVTDVHQSEKEIDVEEEIKSGSLAIIKLPKNGELNENTSAESLAFHKAKVDSKTEKNQTRTSFSSSQILNSKGIEESECQTGDYKEATSFNTTHSQSVLAKTNDSEGYETESSIKFECVDEAKIFADDISSNPKENENQTNNYSDIFYEISSLTTESSSDDDITSLDDIIKDMSCYGKHTEEVNIVETSIKLQAPQWMEQDSHQTNESNNLKLKVDWVYGCNTGHSQSMASLETGELVYYVGCVVIVYDYVRNVQRHYLQHTGMVTSIAAHPDETMVASAQAHSSAKCVERIYSDLPHFSREVQVRVWNHVTMETIHVIGSGILRSAVYKMQFLNLPGYFATVEHNDEGTITVWDGGCRVTSRRSIVPEPQISPKEITKSKKSSPRFNSVTMNSKLKKNRQEKKKPSSKINNGPKGLAACLLDELGFVTAGKENLSFWKLETIEDDDVNDVEVFQICEPIFGDFGKSFFRAQFISVCQSTSKFMECSIVTGDTNGTLLVWSEKNKTAMRGFSHAHECHLSAICVSDDGCIFTAGAKDRLVKAFVSRKSKLENCGMLEIPPDLGSATCLIVIEQTLFVATENNVIITTTIDKAHFTSSANTSSSPTSIKKPVYSKITSRSYSTSALLSSTKSSSLPQTSTAADENLNSIFTKWDELEIAKGFGKGVTCACQMKALFPKNQLKKAQPRYLNKKNVNVISQPSLSESLAIVRRQMLKSAGVRKRLHDFSIKTPRSTKTIHAWRSVTPSNEDNKDKRHPMLSASSPRLRTNERILSREKAKAEDFIKPIPTFAFTDWLDKNEIFYDDVRRLSSIANYFVSSSENGWLLIYNSQEHKIVGRYKVPATGNITCLDTCSRRHLIVVGTSSGHVIVIQISPKGFEPLIPPMKCRCSGGGASTINKVCFSPSGRKLAVSIGYDIIVLFVSRSQLSEKGRCIGHQNAVVTGLDWSLKKYSGVYFLRSYARESNELKTWDSEKMMEVKDQDLLARIRWATQTCSLDFCTKGIWEEFSKPNDITSVSITSCNVKSKDRSRQGDDDQTSLMTSSSNSDVYLNKTIETSKIREIPKMLLIGTRDGCLNMQPFPCLDWNRVHTYVRAHTSPMRSLTTLVNQLHVVTTSDEDASIVQWTLKED